MGGPTECKPCSPLCTVSNLTSYTCPFHGHGLPRLSDCLLFLSTPVCSHPWASVLFPQTSAPTPIRPSQPWRPPPRTPHPPFLLSLYSICHWSIMGCTCLSVRVSSCSSLELKLFEDRESCCVHLFLPSALGTVLCTQWLLNK